MSAMKPYQGRRIDVLVVEDVPTDARLMEARLRHSGLVPVVRRVETEREFRKALAERTPDIILTDYDLPRFSAPAALKVVRELEIDAPVILVTGAIDEDTAIELLNDGVVTYVFKDDLGRLAPSVITALERAEARAREWHLSEILERSLHEIYVFDVDMLHFRYVNETALRNLGYTLDELRDLTPLDLKHRLSARRFRSTLEELKHGERRGVTFVTTHRRKDGSEYPVEVHLDVSRMGRSPVFVALVLDLTDRITAQDALEASERRFRAIVTAAGDGVIVADSEGRIIDCNPAAAELLGYRETELRGRFVREIMPERYRDAHRAAMATATVDPQRHEPLTVEIEALRADGTEFPVALTVSGWREGDDRYFSAFLRDLSDRDAREQERRLLATVVEQGDESVAITDVDGVVQYVNAAFTRMTGFEEREVVGRHVEALDTGHVSPDLIKEMADALRSGRIWEGAYESARKDGTRYWKRVRMYPVRDASGTIIYYVGVGQDVTLERELEAQLRQAQKMEAVGQVTAGIAHDFNNVLSSVLTNTQLALLDVPDGASDLAEELRDIERAARHGGDMVRKLMTFSRGAGLEREVEDLARVVQEVARSMRRLLPESIEVRYEAVRGQVRCLVDAGVVQQTLLNLATNARDAMPEGGLLELSIEAEERAAPADGDNAPAGFARVKVRDTGVGMDPRTLGRIFDPFFTTKPPGKGTGLGMAMVYSLMEQHGGRVEVESEPGKGTTVSLLFPTTRQELPPERRAGEGLGNDPELPTGSGIVLVVEDEAPLRRAARRILQRVGYTVRTARDGSEALALVKADPAALDAVVTDLVMPRLGGGALWKAAREAGCRAPFIFTSGYTAEETHENDVLPPDAYFLRKPWSMEELARALADVLTGSRAAASGTEAGG